MLSSRIYIHLNYSGRHLGSSSNNHDICVTGKNINEGSEIRVAHFHTLELGRGLGTTQLELLDDIGYTLEPVAIVMLSTIL